MPYFIGCYILLVSNVLNNIQVMLYNMLYNTSQANLTVARLDMPTVLCCSCSDYKTQVKLA